MMSARAEKAYIIRFKADESDAGLYLPRFNNDFGTSLAARGPVEDLNRLLGELRS